MLERIFDVFDGIEMVLYACCEAILLIGSGIWIFTKAAEVNLVLAIAGVIGLVLVVGGPVIHDLIRCRLSRLTKFLLAGWALATFVAMAIELMIVMQS